MSSGEAGWGLSFKWRAAWINPRRTAQLFSSKCVYAMGLYAASSLDVPGLNSCQESWREMGLPAAGLRVLWLPPQQLDQGVGIRHGAYDLDLRASLSF